MSTQSLALHCVLAFVSGLVIEALYALGVLFIGERKNVAASASSVVWGAAFLFGVNESFRSWVAAVLWCVGLGVGTTVGMWLKRGNDERA